MLGSIRRWAAPALALVFLLAPSAPPAAACPFCVGDGKTLTSEIGQANMVLVGTLKDADVKTETTKLVVETVIRDQDKTLKGNELVLPRYLPEGVGKKYKFLVFCDVYKGNVDPYRGVAVKAEVDIAGYLKGAWALKDAKEAKRLAFFFDYLDNEDIEISSDAYLEFAKADPKDTRDMVKALPPEKLDKVEGWLKHPRTPAFRYGLYASMLGYSGNQKYAGQLRAMLANPDTQTSSGVNGVLAGYVMLQPKEGWAHLYGVLGDPGKEFMYRYAALQAARFFYDNPPSEEINRAKVVGAVAQLLKQKDIADLAVEDFRKWKRWDMAEQVLALQTAGFYDVPIVRRSVLRYCLSCQDVNKNAAAFVKSERERDAQGVEEVEELLRLETTPPPAPK
jgi:hypothetical protein